ncbi:hypothetical protein FKM82_026990 [Ascaphus truei]
MDAVLGTSFSVNVDSINNPNDPFVINGRKLFDFNILSPLIILTVLFPCIIPALEKMNFCFFSKSVIQFFTDAIKRFRNTRQKGIQVSCSRMFTTLTKHVLLSFSSAILKII